MCYNENISLLAYLTGMSGSLALLSSKKIPEGLFYGSVVQMQLVEYFLWKNQPCQISKKNKICNDNELKNCSETNKTISTYGVIINHLEPLILFGGIVLFSNKTLPLSLIIFFCIFMILLFLYTINIFNQEDENNLCTTVSEESDPHLNWKWNREAFNVIIYTLFLIILILLSYYGLENGSINAILILIGYISSYIIYRDKHSIGAMWCFSAAFAPWILYFLYKIY
jgi:hypothetical protein